MTTTTMNQVAEATQRNSTARLLETAEGLRRYLRRIPPDCRTKAMAALADLERRIREARS